MRLFLAALTIGAAGLACAYMQQMPAPAAESRSQAGHQLFDWQSAGDTLASVDPVDDAQADPPLVVHDTATASEVASVLDEFVRTTTPAVRAEKSEIASDVASAGGVTESDLVPFATTESPASIGTALESTDIVPADASAAANQSGPADIEVAAAPPSDAIASDANRSSQGKPSINEATLVTKKPTTKSDTKAKSAEPSRSASQPPSVAKQPAVAPNRSKTELLPGGKLPPKVSPFDADWTVVGKSPAGLTMHTRRFGRQGTRTFVIAGLDGRDLVGARWNDELVSALMKRPELLQANEILVFRAGNPDGLTKKVSVNSRNVLINRNFPSRRYQFLTDRTAGSGPGSEAETKLIVDALSAFQPRRIVHLTSTTGTTSVQYNRAAGTVADELRTQFKLAVRPLDVELAPGSIEDYADGTLDAAVISLRLSSGADWQQAWKSHLPAVLTAVYGQNPDKLQTVSEELALSSPEPMGSKIVVEEEPPPRVKRNTGYEELPAPPKL